MRLTKFTRLEEMPAGAIWDFIRRLYAEGEASYRYLGHILNGAATEGKVAMLLSRRALGVSVKLDPNLQRQGQFSGSEFDKVIAKAAGTEMPILGMTRGYVYHAGGRSTAGAFEVINAEVLTMLAIIHGQEALYRQRTTFYFQYDSRDESAPRLDPHGAPHAAPQKSSHGTGIGTGIGIGSGVGTGADGAAGAIKSADAERGLSPSSLTGANPAQAPVKGVELFAKLAREYDLCSNELLEGNAEDAIEQYETAVAEVVRKYLEQDQTPIKVNVLIDAMEDGAIDIAIEGLDRVKNAYRDALQGRRDPAA